MTSRCVRLIGVAIVVTSSGTSMYAQQSDVEGANAVLDLRVEVLRVVEHGGHAHDSRPLVVRQRMVAHEENLLRRTPRSLDHRAVHRLGGLSPAHVAGHDDNVEKLGKPLPR